MGLVVYSITCGPGKYCFEQNSTFKNQDTSIERDVKKYNFREEFDNSNRCHCQCVWRPSLCEDRGSGSSIDTAPAPYREHGIWANILDNVKEALAPMSV